MFISCLLFLYFSHHLSFLCSFCFVFRFFFLIKMISICVSYETFSKRALFVRNILFISFSLFLSPCNSFIIIGNRCASIVLNPKMLEASLYISQNLPDGANGLWAVVHCATWVALGELEWIPFPVLRKSIDINLLGMFGCFIFFILKKLPSIFRTKKKALPSSNEPKQKRKMSLSIPLLQIFCIISLLLFVLRCFCYHYFPHRQKKLYAPPNILLENGENNRAKVKTKGQILTAKRKKKRFCSFAFSIHLIKSIEFGFRCCTFNADFPTVDSSCKWTNNFLDFR